MDSLLPLLRAASYIAESSQPPRNDGTSIFDNMGHIYDVPEQVLFYSKVAMIPSIKTICEIGFNWT